MVSEVPHDVCVRARYVFSHDGSILDQPLENVTLRIHDGVVSVDHESQPDIDLGNVAIIPALVNAHTHLEFSSLKRPFPRNADDSFADWISQVLHWRGQRDESSRTADDEGREHVSSVSQGLRESAQSGVQLIGEIATQLDWPDTYHADSDSRRKSPTIHHALGGVRFLELIGLGADRIDNQIIAAEKYLETPSPTPRWQPGLSPHAPYTVALKLLETVVSFSRRFRAPIAMHLAETFEELQLLSSHCGPLVELLQELGFWDPMAVPRGIQPRDYLEQLSSAHRTLIIHGNYLTPADWSLLSQHADTMSVVYCPRTFDYFGHCAYPLEKMLAAGVHMAVGTDSRASNPDLDLFAELRFIRQQHPSVASRDVIKLGTENGARALGIKTPELQTVELPDQDLADPFELLLLAEAD